jgi:hypothetical protein
MVPPQSVFIYRTPTQVTEDIFCKVGKWDSFEIEILRNPIRGERTGYVVKSATHVGRGY